MPLIDCTLDITLDISNVSPGDREAWAPGDPVISWGDGTSVGNVAGTTESHTYQSVGEYTITLDGTNACGDTCSHSKNVVRTLKPSDQQVSDIDATSVTISWDDIGENDGYGWELYKNGALLDSGETTNPCISLYNLTPSTPYMMCISTIVGATYSVDYCDDSEFHFTTPSDDCQLPICGFTLS